MLKCYRVILLLFITIVLLVTFLALADILCNTHWLFFFISPVGKLQKHSCSVTTPHMLWIRV